MRKVTRHGSSWPFGQLQEVCCGFPALGFVLACCVRGSVSSEPRISSGRSLPSGRLQRCVLQLFKAGTLRPPAKLLVTVAKNLSISEPSSEALCCDLASPFCSSTLEARSKFRRLRDETVRSRTSSSYNVATEAFASLLCIAMHSTGELPLFDLSRLF